MKQISPQWYAGAMALTLAVSGYASTIGKHLTADLAQEASGIRFASPAVSAVTAKELTEQCRSICAQHAIGDGGWYKYGIDDNGDLVRVHAKEGEEGAARGTSCDFIPYGIWTTTYQSGQQCLCGVRQGNINLSEQPISGVEQVLGPETVPDDGLDNFIHERTKDRCGPTPGYFGICIYATADNAQDGNECQGFCLAMDPKVCNPNQTCEPLAGENPVNCPADCWTEGGSIPSPYCLADKGQPGAHYDMEEFQTPWTSPVQPSNPQNPVPTPVQTTPDIKPVQLPPSIPIKVDQNINPDTTPIVLDTPIAKPTSPTPVSNAVGSSYEFEPFDAPLPSAEQSSSLSSSIELTNIISVTPPSSAPTEAITPSIPLPNDELVIPVQGTTPTQDTMVLEIPLATSNSVPAILPEEQTPLLQDTLMDTVDTSSYWLMMIEKPVKK